jgi:hypothetical protein
MRHETRRGARSMQLPRPFVQQDDKVPKQSTTALPKQRIDWMPRHHMSKIMT